MKLRHSSFTLNGCPVLRWNDGNIVERAIAAATIGNRSVPIFREFANVSLDLAEKAVLLAKNLSFLSGREKGFSFDIDGLACNRLETDPIVAAKEVGFQFGLLENLMPRAEVDCLGALESVRGLLSSLDTPLLSFDGNELDHSATLNAMTALHQRIWSDWPVARSVVDQDVQLDSGRVGLSLERFFEFSDTLLRTNKVPDCRELAAAICRIGTKGYTYWASLHLFINGCVPPLLDGAKHAMDNWARDLNAIQRFRFLVASMISLLLEGACTPNGQISAREVREYFER